MAVFVVRAPTRIDFAGSYTDLVPFASRRPGAVLNAAIDLYVHMTLYPTSKSDDLENDDVNIYAADFDTYIRTSSVGDVEHKEEFGLLEVIPSRLPGSGGANVTIWSDGPANSGLGSSGAVGVALIGVLCKYTRKAWSRRKIADVANEIERGIGVNCGKQDQYASALGGINYMEFHGEEVCVSNLSLGPDVQQMLKRRVCLCYTGKARHARDLLQSAVDLYLGGDSRVVAAIANLTRLSSVMREALVAGDARSFGELLHETWQSLKQLHPAVSNSQIDSLFDLAYQNGALGGKACGAGGGGCLVFFCAEGRTHQVQERLRGVGVEVLDFHFDYDGLQVWMKGGVDET